MSLFSFPRLNNKSVFKNITQKLGKLLIFVSFPLITLAQNTVAQNSNEGQTPMYDSLMRNESAALSREQQCFATLNTVTYQGTRSDNVYIYYAECSQLSQTFDALTYACVNQPEISCELIYEHPKQ